MNDNIVWTPIDLPTRVAFRGTELSRLIKQLCPSVVRFHVTTDAEYLCVSDDDWRISGQLAISLLTIQGNSIIQIEFGSGYGSGYGYVDGDGSGNGSGYGYGSGYGSGSGYGNGNGYGYGYGNGIGYDIGCNSSIITDWNSI